MLLVKNKQWLILSALVLILLAVPKGAYAQQECGHIQTTLGPIPNFACLADALALRVDNPKPIVTLVSLTEDNDSANFSSLAESLRGGPAQALGQPSETIQTQINQGNFNVAPNWYPPAQQQIQQTYDIDIPQSSMSNSMFIHVPQ